MKSKYTSVKLKSFKFSAKFNCMIVMKAKKRLVCDLGEVNDAGLIKEIDSLFYKRGSKLHLCTNTTLERFQIMVGI